MVTLLHRYFAVFIVACLSLCSTWSHAEVSASVDRYSLAVGETLTLSL